MGWVRVCAETLPMYSTSQEWWWTFDVRSTNLSERRGKCKLNAVKYAACTCSQNSLDRGTVPVSSASSPLPYPNVTCHCSSGNSVTFTVNNMGKCSHAVLNVEINAWAYMVGLITNCTCGCGIGPQQNNCSPSHASVLKNNKLSSRLPHTPRLRLVAIRGFFCSHRIKCPEQQFNVCRSSFLLNPQ